MTNPEIPKSPRPVSYTCIYTQISQNGIISYLPASWGHIPKFQIYKNINDGTHSQFSGTIRIMANGSQWPVRKWMILNLWKSILDFAQLMEVHCSIDKLSRTSGGNLTEGRRWPISCIFWRLPFDWSIKLKIDALGGFQQLPWHFHLDPNMFMPVWRLWLASDYMKRINKETVGV